jgi:serine phosphatase RsbU (regulator of sigma subunit)
VDLIRRNADQSAEFISSRLRDEIEAFRGAAKQRDDVTFVILKVNAPA